MRSVLESAQKRLKIGLCQHRANVVRANSVVYFGDAFPLEVGDVRVLIQKTARDAVWLIHHRIGPVYGLDQPWTFNAGETAIDDAVASVETCEAQRVPVSSEAVLAVPDR